MELCLITPIKYVEQTRQLSGRFCIAPIAASNSVYRKFFEDAAQNGYRVILDNGVFEGNCLTDEALIDLAVQMEVRTLVAPDQISGNCKEGYARAEIFVKLARKHGYVNDLMFVPQVQRSPNAVAEIYAIFTQLVSQADNKERIFKYIGICRDTVFNAYSHIIPRGDQELYRLIFMCREYVTIKQLLDHEYHFHYLGVGSRLDLLSLAWFVDSADTASFFTAAVQNNRIINGQLEKGIKRPKDYFNWQLNEDQELSLAHSDLRNLCWEAQKWADKATERYNAEMKGRV